MKKIFLFIACSYLIFFFLIPPFQSPDEPEHYETTFWVSQFKWPYIPTKKQAPLVKYQMAEITKVYDSNQVNKPFILPNFNQIKSSSLRHKSGYTEKEIKKFSQMSSNAYHPPVVFFLSSLFIHIANIFKSDLITKFYMARLSSMFLYFGTVFIVYNIFKQLFENKKIISSLLIFFSINPLLLSISSGINPDNAIIFFSALVFYLFLRLSNKKITFFNCIIFGLLCGIATLSKFSGLTTLGFIGLMFLIKYKITKEFFQKAIILTMSWLVVVLPWFGLNFSRYHKPIVDNFTIAPRFINPANPISGSIASILEFRHTFMHYSGFLGWNETHGPKIYFFSYAIVIMILTILGLLAIIKKRDNKLNFFIIYYLLFIVFLFFVGLNFKLLGVAWDIQGRYLLPAFFCMPNLFSYGLSLLTRKPIEVTSRLLMFFSIIHYYYVLFFILIPKYYV